MQGWNRQTDMTPVSFVSESIESSTMVGKESALNHLLTGNDIKVTFRLIPETNSSWICVAGRSLSASLALRPRERRWWQLFAHKCAHSSKKTYRFNTINKKKLMCIRLINYAKHQKICLWKREANCSTNWGGNIYAHETSWDCMTPGLEPPNVFPLHLGYIANSYHSWISWKIWKHNKLLPALESLPSAFPLPRIFFSSTLHG